MRGPDPEGENQTSTIISSTCCRNLNCDQREDDISGFWFAACTARTLDESYVLRNRDELRRE
jgi:hypothetical protein